MNPLKRSPLYSSVFALVATAVALLVSVFLRPFLGIDAVLVFLFAIWISTWYHGRMGGLIASIGSLAAVFYCLFAGGPSRDTLPGVWLRVAVFALLAALITGLTAALREGRRMLDSTLSSIGDAVLATDREGHVTFLNPVAETLTGWPGADARGKPVTEVLRLIDERSREPVENPLLRALHEQVVVAPPDPALLISRSGAEITTEQNAAPVRAASGELRGGILVFRDVAKRRHLEEQVTHSQKMDAVGRLAGGVAGDFNNVLTVITGYAELLRGEVPASSQLRRFVDEIIYAGERAAALTRHLLAFSRGPRMQPQAVDLNSLLGNMEAMLRRFLGQTIELILLPGSGLGRIQADPAQIEQVIANLAANSRDAMPHGGKFVIETANVELGDADGQALSLKPGAYVMLAVSDTGAGMDPETRSRLFEPFFTTKDPGKGSGLGLATAYGIIRQCEGQISVYSQPSCGTIFEIYLPRAPEVVPETVRKAPPKGSETILLVDDEEGVRKLIIAVLRSQGYDVLEAENADAALAAYEKNRHKIDMVLTDVVMPDMNGFDLGRELTTQDPGLRILYMSGFRDNPIGANAEEAPRAFLQKPFTPDALLGKVREVLDAEVA